MLAVLFLNGMNMKRRVACKTKIKQVQSKSSEDVGSSASCCRTCLSTGNLEPIFCDKDSEKKRSHDLNMVTGLKINMDDGLPQKICGRCSETINIALQFRRTSKKAQKELIKMTTKKKKYKLRKKTKDPIRDDEDGLDDYELLGDGYLNEDNYHDDNEFPDEADEPPMDSDMVENEIEQVEETLQKPGDKRKRLVIPNASSYKCGTCSKEFRMKATYKAHMRFHTNYCVCETCGKRCRNNHQLQEHKRARHGLGRIHKCAYCEYSSATKEALVIHERRHTGERPYICDHCGATFHRRSNLVQHIAIHLPEKNFQCDLCPKRLKSRKFLQIHKHNAHTGRKYGYLCPVCDHRFEKPNKVRAHVRRVHGLMDEQQGPIVRVEL